MSRRLPVLSARASHAAPVVALREPPLACPVPSVCIARARQDLDAAPFATAFLEALQRRGLVAARLRVELQHTGRSTLSRVARDDDSQAQDWSLRACPEDAERAIHEALPHFEAVQCLVVEGAAFAALYQPKLAILITGPNRQLWDPDARAVASRIDLLLGDPHRNVAQGIAQAFPIATGALDRA